MADSKHITVPLSESSVLGLHRGNSILLSGTIHTARDVAHKRLFDMIQKGEQLPFDLSGQVLYYAGPAPAKPGKIIGPIGPTSSYRMDPYTSILLENGLKGMIGKGNRSEAVIFDIQKNKAVYFAAVGGAAALIARCVRKVEIIAFEDLGPEAIHRLEVEDFPLVVAVDCHGGDLFREGVEKYRRI
jgi:fumarate hydratase subunit beta